MRFLAEGPSIPNRLLAAHERGKVLFLCGAGVSIPAGLPGFLTLAGEVAKILGIPANDPYRSAITALLKDDPEARPVRLDEAFDEWQRTYSRSDIEAKVARLLAAKRDIPTDAHHTLLALSKDTSGKVRLITTNFDRLFTRADRDRTPIFDAPRLPDLESVDALNGIVHLHGGISERGAEDVPSMVLSEADFGRAYLSEGWAARFFRQTVSKYIVVLIGYSADDAPVRYLLKGLRHLNGAGRRDIYAFANGAEKAVEDKWKALGVEAIVYEPRDKEHSGLWLTLEAWAERAKDQRAWRSQIVEMAQKGPRALQPFQRGQVAALIETVEGAESFLQAAPPPSAEWICVFDALVRYSEPRPLKLLVEERFDPFAAYGLDDDPPRPKQWPRLSDHQNPRGHSPIEARSDEWTARPSGIAWPYAARPQSLPPRLNRLARWLALDWRRPVTMWWVAKRGGMHPDFVEAVQHQMRRDKTLAPIARNTWRLIIEGLGRHEFENRFPWYELKDRIDAEGWTVGVKRTFEDVVMPRLRTKPPWSADFAAALAEPETLRTKDIANIDIDWFHADGDLIVPNELKPFVVAAFRKALIFGAMLIEDVGEIYFRAPSILPEDGPGERSISDDGAFFVRFVRAFEELARLAPEAAAAELMSWPVDEPIFFAKLRVWAVGDPKVATADFAFDAIMRLSDESLWQRDLWRELLHTLKARWSDLSEEQRNAFAKRIILGGPRWKFEEEKEYPARKACYSAMILSWLKANGCTLPEIAEKALESLKAVAGDWRESWGASADHSFDGRSGWVGTNSDPKTLVDLPLGEIAAAAQKLSGHDGPGTFVRHDPFQGLVQNHPLIALSSLALEARRGRHPEKLWVTLLSHWPKTAPVRLTKLLAHRLLRAPATLHVAVRYSAPSWLRDHGEALGSTLQLAVLDQVLACLSDAADTASSVICSSVGGVEEPNVNMTFDAAFAGPVGVLSEIVLDQLRAMQPKRSSEMPEPVATRLKALLNSPGDGQYHAAAILANELLWLHWIAPDWVANNLIPRMSMSHDHAIAMWNGFFRENRLPSPALFAALKPNMIDAIERADFWADGSGVRRLGEFLALGACYSTPTNPYASWEETRAALQKTTAEVRLAALHVIANATEQKSGWRKYVRPFLESGWPRELRLQTPETTRAMLEIVSKAGKHVPEAVQTVLPLLTQAEHIDSWTWRIRGEDKASSSLARDFPEECLTLLDAVTPTGADRTPYGLHEVLGDIAESEPKLRLDQRWLRLDRQARRL